MSDEKPEPKRRDFLITAAMATAGAGATVALWPFFAAMNPAADIRAKRVIFDLADLRGGALTYLEMDQAPLIVFRRSEEELTRLRDPSLYNTPREPGSAMGYGFRDRDSLKSSQPDGAKNWHRSLRPEIMICFGRCTREGCVVRRTESFFSHELQCPCCGSKYDLAGRAFSGPAPGNLTVPPHRYISATHIELGDGMHPA